VILFLVLALTLTGLAGIWSVDRAAAGIVVVDGDWTVTGTDNVYDGTIFKVDGNITIESGAVLDIRNGGIIFLEDSTHIYRLEIRDGASGHGTLILDNSFLTTEPNQLSDYLKLDIIVAGTLILRNGSLIKHPGTLTTSGTAVVDVRDSEITGFTTEEISSFNLDPDDNDDAPVMTFGGSSSVVFAASKITRLYENTASPGPDSKYNVTVKDTSTVTIIDSYVGVDFLDDDTKHNVIAAEGSSRVYIYNMTLDETQSNTVDPSEWVPALVPVGTGSTFYIHRWLDTKVLDRFGSAVGGAYIESKILPTGQLAYYPDNGNLNVPSSTLLGYLGRTSSDFNVTDSSGRALVPLLTEWINESVFDPTAPNSNFIGNYRVRTSFGGDVEYEDITFSSYPSMTALDNTISLVTDLDGVVWPAQDNTYLWDTTMVIDYDLELDGNIRVTADVTLNGATLTIIQGDIETGRHYLIIEGTGSLTIQEGGLASNLPLVVYLKDSGRFTALDSQVSLNTPEGRGVIYSEGSAVVDIRGGTLNGDLTGLGASVSLKGVSVSASDLTFDTSGTSYLWDPTLADNVTLALLSDDGSVSTLDFDIRNVTFSDNMSATVVFTGTQYAQLTNVTFLVDGDWWSGRIFDSAKVGVYWWLTVQTVDGVGSDVRDANITLERLNPDTLAFELIPAPGPDDLYLGTWVVDHAEAPAATILYRALAQERVATQGWSNSTYRANGSKVIEAVTFYADSNLTVVMDSNSQVDLVFSDLTPELSMANLAFQGPNDGYDTQPVDLSLEIKADIRNEGKVREESVTVHFYRIDVDVDNDGVMDNPPDDYSSFLLGQANISIEALSTATASIPWTPTVTGTYVISVVVDQGDARKEFNETNNIIKTTLQVVAWPDLSVQTSDVSLSRVPVEEGQVDVQVTVTNSGKATAEGAIVRLYDNTTLVDSASVDVPAGSSATVILSWAPDLAGTHNLTVQVLSRNDTFENTDFRMEDNAVLLSVNVLTKPDLEVRPSEFESVRVVKGKGFTVEVVVYNVGNTDASNFEVALYLDEVSEENLLALRIGLDIPAGSNLTLLMEANPINVAGNYTLIILVDSTGVIPEVREDNNRVDIPLEVVPPEGQVFIMTPEEGKSYNLGAQVFVTGKATTPTGQPIPDTKVTLVLKDPQEGFHDAKTVFTDQNGEFVVGLNIPSDAPSGEWTLIASAEVETIQGTTLKLNVEKVVPWYELTVPMVGVPLWMLIAILAIFLLVVLAVTAYMRTFGLGRLVECGECGAFIPESSQTCPKCGTEFEKEMAKCSSCHAWIPADVKKCPECGVEFTTGKAKASDYRERMRKQYEKVVDKYRAEAARALGHKPTEKEFQEWWRRQPTYVTFESWLKEEEEMRKMGSKPCPRCGTLNSITATVCHKCGTLMSSEAPTARKPPGGPRGGTPGAPPSGPAPKPPTMPPGGAKAPVTKKRVDKPVMKKIVKKPFAKKEKEEK
jgi:subtilase family serine protease/ribosomal protein L40E